MNEWISVNDRLPETDNDYLVLTESKDIFKAYFNEYSKEFGSYSDIYDTDTLGYVDSEWLKYEEITHWMPLPQPPKEVQE